MGYLIENIIEKAINISISNKSQDYIRIDFANFNILFTIN